MKLLMEPIDVKIQQRSVATAATNTSAEERRMTVRATEPRAFCWRGQLYEVEGVLESWLARGQWWGAEDYREYYMLLTQRGVMEVFKGREGWMLSRIVD